MTRPRALVVVLGTATEVGKTWVSVEVLRRLRAAGYSIAARKPAQSFAPDELGATDADQLGAATGEAPTTVCPAHRWYPTPMAPPMAADVLERPRITLDDLIAETTWPTLPVDVGLVEAAGGPCSPLAHDGDGVDLAIRLEADRVVLVADAGLGTISAVRLAAGALRSRHAPDPLIHLNRYRSADDLHERNRRWLASESAPATTEVADLARLLVPH